MSRKIIAPTSTFAQCRTSAGRKSIIAALYVGVHLSARAQKFCEQCECFVRVRVSQCVKVMMPVLDCNLIFFSAKSSSKPFEKSQLPEVEHQFGCRFATIKKRLSLVES